LFDVLFETVKRARIPVVCGWEVANSELHDGARILISRDGARSEAFDFVVDAIGMRSTLTEPCGRHLAYGALWATVDWPDGAEFSESALEQRYCAANIMAGLMPTGRLKPSGTKLATFFWSLRADQLEAWRRSGLGSWKQQVLEIWPALEPVLSQITLQDQLTFAHYLHRTLPSPAEERLIHLGDSWHSTSPQLGQGANMALLDAYALSMALELEAALPKALAKAAQLRRRHVRLYQALSLALTPFYQSDSRVLPAIRELLVPHVARLWPATWIQAAMVSGLLGDPLARLGLEAVLPPKVMVDDSDA